ncbi:MAG: class I SAM-dependent methyltransferase, partial [Candidatus Omnitrophica bacterium]|nr:class I SAM-dependent methyltransferase [Candidatus Omnitrophota bacterium]
MTIVISKALPCVLKEVNVQVMLDAPCGDYYWMSHVNMDIKKYIGVDIVKELVKRNQKRYGS